MKKFCKVCDQEIPQKRVELGYKDTCANHSEAFKYVGFVTSIPDANYDISIVRDLETAKHMQRLCELRGAS